VNPVHDRPGKQAGDWLLVSSKFNLSIAPVHIVLTNLCIALVPVHIYTNFTMANQKAPSKLEDSRAQD